MDCREVRDRLVALQDGELSPGELAQVGEHLRGCPACADRERMLARATPSIDLRVPPAVRALLEERVDGDVILALAERDAARPAAQPSVGDRVRRWLRREARVPAPALVAYGALLALALGWGLSNWWTLSALRAAPTTAAAGPVLPADQFAPAAYDASLPARLHDDDAERSAGDRSPSAGEAEHGGLH